MPKKFYSPKLLNRAQTLRAAWMEIDPEISFGKLTLQVMSSDIDRTWKLEEEMARLESMLVEKRNQRELFYSTLHENMKCIRATVRGIYGDDSAEYEMVGGTRMSARKTRSRKVAA